MLFELIHTLACTTVQRYKAVDAEGTARPSSRAPSRFRMTVTEPLSELAEVNRLLHKHTLRNHSFVHMYAVSSTIDMRMCCLKFHFVFSGACHVSFCFSAPPPHPILPFLLTHIVCTSFVPPTDHHTQIVELDADCVSLHFGRRAAFVRVLTDHRKWTVRGAAPGIAKLKAELLRLNHDAVLVRPPRADQ
jgi:hypothetical protein